MVVWKLGPYHCNVSRGGSEREARTSVLIWPHFTWLNIENNYSNDDNDDLMAFYEPFLRVRPAAGESQFK